MERLLAEARERLTATMPPKTVQRILEVSGDVPFVVMDPSGTILTTNAAFLAIYQMTASEMVGASLERFRSDYQSTLVYEHLQDVLSRGEGWWGELCHCTPTESLRWVEAFIVAVSVDEIDYHVGLCRDNTDSHRTDSPMQLHDLVLEQMAESVIICDASTEDTPIIYVNQAWIRMTGYSLEESIGRNARFLQGPDTDEAVVEQIRQHLGDGRLFHGELLNYRKDGTPFWNELELRPVRGQDGKLTHFVGTCTDVTERRHFRAQSDFEESVLKNLARGQRLDDVLTMIVTTLEREFPALKFGFYLVETEEKVLSARTAPTTPPQVFGQWDGVTVDAQNGFCAAAAAMGRLTVEPDFSRLPDSEFKREALDRGFLGGWAVPVSSGAEAPIGTMMVLSGSPRHPTEGERSFCQVAAGLAAIAIERWLDDELRAHLERQLRRAQKMEAVGTLAGGIAHDFNNILTGIFGFVQLARDDLPAEHSVHQWLEEVMAAAMRARDVVRQILTFSRQQEQEVGPCDIERVTSEAIKLISSMLPSTIEVQMVPAANLPVVQADPVQVHQAMVNLCTNAWHAMPEGAGKITVSLVDLTLPTDGLTTPTEIPEGRYICIAVKDNGEGMSAIMLDRIFEPFFTTKPTGKGSGLGLAVVHGIMQAQNGGVLVESEEGKGSTFYLAFPVEEAEVKEPPPPKPHIVKGDGQSLLLVDDEKPIVGWLRALLKRSGYAVTGYEQPVDALAAFEADPQGFDLVLTDLTMPGLTGIDLARKIRKIRDDVPVVLMSGYDDISAPDLLHESGICEVLRKPLMAETLTTALARVLSQS
ncbi:PAS domain-containing protein [Actomonas aquatica]|uniref:histidine kinase n=1 Tax=Actomonas aquatica TaxID=2866162 RepID=A0ABZ1C7B1_9BACT|nr:PAS domain-containing protein [Opitutus sp. WL0086]WRQ87613.1 PAS domain-containing protein [Opitutus sp. WL0086]